MKEVALMTASWNILREKKVGRSPEDHRLEPNGLALLEAQSAGPTSRILLGEAGNASQARQID